MFTFPTNTAFVIRCGRLNQQIPVRAISLIPLNIMPNWKHTSANGVHTFSHQHYVRRMCLYFVQSMLKCPSEGGSFHGYGTIKALSYSISISVMTLKELRNENTELTQQKKKVNYSIVILDGNFHVVDFLGMSFFFFFLLCVPTK